MDRHIKDFFSEFRDGAPKGNFHKAIVLDEKSRLDWEEVVKMVPDICRGWYELTALSAKDRIEFTRDFWLSKLNYHPELNDFLTHFFASLDDIKVFITQQKFDDPFEACLIYSLKNGQGFFRGASPASDSTLVQLKKSFPDFIFPKDYLEFLQIHNGFCKATDVSGVYAAACMKSHYDHFQEMLELENAITTSNGKVVNPKKLIPFYESFGMPFFQCFWGEWYPEQEMGNVYYSGISKMISDIDCSDASSESMAFPTFVDWLMFYLEQIA